MKLDRDVIYELYIVQKKSLKEISSTLNTSPQNVHYYLKKFGIPRRNYSDAIKNIKRNPEWNENIRKSLTSKKLSETTKQKIRNKAVNRPSPLKGLSKCKNPDKIKGGNSGAEHWNWRGGTSSMSNRIRQSSEYLDWRRLCMIRDNYTCRFCKKKSSRGCKIILNVHHIIPFNYLVLNNKYLFDVRNGVTLCKKCHQSCHSQKLN